MRYLGLVMIVLGGALCIEPLLLMVMAVQRYGPAAAIPIGRTLVGPMFWLCVGILLRARAAERAAGSLSQAGKKS